jgi:hypothetical protein
MCRCKKVVSFLTNPNKLLFSLPVLFWFIFVYYEHYIDIGYYPFEYDENITLVILSTSISFTIYSIIQNYPFLIETMYSKTSVYEDLTLVDINEITYKRGNIFEQSFLLITQIIITLSVWIMIYSKLFHNYHIYSAGQLFAFTSATGMGIYKIQLFACKLSLSILLKCKKQQHSKIEQIEMDIVEI